MNVLNDPFLKNKNDPFVKIFVTIGFDSTNGIPIIPDMLVVYNSKETTAIQMAKRVRKEVADHPEDYGWAPGTKFKPSDLYWTIRDERDSKICLWSKNYQGEKP